jgi:hypothetical protein
MEYWALLPHQSLKLKKKKKYVDGFTLVSANHFLRIYSSNPLRVNSLQKWRYHVGFFWYTIDLPPCIQYKFVLYLSILLSI